MPAVAAAVPVAALPAAAEQATVPVAVAAAAPEPAAVQAHPPAHAGDTDAALTLLALTQQPVQAAPSQ
jgi:hypothetical protein